MGVQLEVVKRTERSAQTQGPVCEVERQVFKMEVFKTAKQKVKRKKKKGGQQQPGSL